jgi:hypothetical protein
VQVRAVDLVEDEELGQLCCADLVQHPADRGDLDEGVGSARVDDVHDEVRVRHLLQSRAESVHQLVGQVADEPDGVAQRVHGCRRPR